MTVRYDENGYLKIVLIFLQAGYDEKLSQAVGVKIKLAKSAGRARGGSRVRTPELRRVRRVIPLSVWELVDAEVLRLPSSGSLRMTLLAFAKIAP